MDVPWNHFSLLLYILISKMEADKVAQQNFGAK